MKLFSNIYKKVIEYSQHKYAKNYLGGVSFLESALLPLPPPDIMLIPMSLAKPAAWWRLALWTTFTSVLGGIAGYLLGTWAYEWLGPLIENWGYGDKFEQVKSLFDRWGIWAILVAGFSPIPYKLFTISAGLLSMAFLPFVIASAVGRGARFFLVALLVAKAGPRMEPLIVKYIEWLGWLTVFLLVSIVGIYQLK
jgi:membrane protein YqaA with SNARE-associated domain